MLAASPPGAFTEVADKVDEVVKKIEQEVEKGEMKSLKEDEALDYDESVVSGMISVMIDNSTVEEVKLEDEEKTSTEEQEDPEESVIVLEVDQDSSVNDLVPSEAINEDLETSTASNFEVKLNTEQEVINEVSLDQVLSPEVQSGVKVQEDSQIPFECNVDLQKIDIMTNESLTRPRDEALAPQVQSVAEIENEVVVNSSSRVRSDEDVSQVDLISQSDLVATFAEPLPSSQNLPPGPVVYEAKASLQMVRHIPPGSGNPTPLSRRISPSKDISQHPVRHVRVGPQPFSRSSSVGVSPIPSQCVPKSPEEAPKVTSPSVMRSHSDNVDPEEQQMAPVPKPRSIYPRKSSIDAMKEKFEIRRCEEAKESRPSQEDEESQCFSLPMDVGSSRRSSQDLKAARFPPPSSLAAKKKRQEASKRSSTTSLHIQRDPESGDPSSPPLRRRNSIHNLPFVDVNDPGTRERMERYKEERRSMLRARFRVEDYVTKKTSPEGERTPLERNSRKKSSPTFDKKHQVESRQADADDQKFKEVKSHLTDREDKKAEELRRGPSRTPPDSSSPRQRMERVQQNDCSFGRKKSENGVIEDEVNVRQRAAIFGAPKKDLESKVKLVSHVNKKKASVANRSTTSPTRKTQVRKLNKKEASPPPPPPGKIKNMAAIFEQKN